MCTFDNELTFARRRFKLMPASPDWCHQTGTQQRFLREGGQPNFGGGTPPPPPHVIKIYNGGLPLLRPSGIQW